MYYLLRYQLLMKELLQSYRLLPIRNGQLLVEMLVKNGLAVKHLVVLVHKVLWK